MSRTMVRNHAIIYAMIASAIVHLSMVTVFSIVIWFPTKETRYFSVDIVQEPSVAPAARAAADNPVPRLGALRMPHSEDLLAGGGTESPDLTNTDAANGMTSWAGLPPINLPRVEFADLERVRTREESLRIRSQFSALFDSRPKDSWSLFNDELHGLGRRIKATFVGSDTGSESRRPARVSTPAPGFGMFVQRMSPPYDRQLLFSPPVQALWNVDALDLAQPLVLVFTASPEGKVVEIQIPVEDEAGLTSEVGNALLKYRFAPIQGDRNQRGTLLLAPDSQDAGGVSLP
jgi:hypothetical protein